MIELCDFARCKYLKGYLYNYHKHSLVITSETLIIIVPSVSHCILVPFSLTASEYAILAVTLMKEALDVIMVNITLLDPTSKL